MASPLKAGDAAPPFELPDQHGTLVSLDMLRGRQVLVYFYPVAFSTDCTEQGCSLRDNRADLTRLGIDVVGISPDPVARQLEFDERYGLGFPLLADVDHRVAERYGVWADYEYDGAIVTGVLRSSFLLDERGIITHAWSPVLAAATAALAMAALETDPPSR